MSDDLVKRLRGDWFGYDVSLKAIDAMAEAADRIEALTADFARQVQRTDEQREAYEQALSVMEAERDRLREAGEKAICHITGYGEASTARIELRAALKGETP